MKKIRNMIKFIYSEKAIKFCEISTVDVVPVKSTVGISQNFVAFSKYMNFNGKKIWNTIYLSPSKHKGNS